MLVCWVRVFFTRLCLSRCIVVFGVLGWCGLRCVMRVVGCNQAYPAFYARPMVSPVASVLVCNECTHSLVIFHVVYDPTYRGGDNVLAGPVFLPMSSYTITSTRYPTLSLPWPAIPRPLSFPSLSPYWSYCTRLTPMFCHVIPCRGMTSMGVDRAARQCRCATSAATFFIQPFCPPVHLVRPCCPPVPPVPLHLVFVLLPAE